MLNACGALMVRSCHQFLSINSYFSLAFLHQANYICIKYFLMRKNHVDQSLREHLRETFATYIKSKNMRQTPERFAILDKALEQKVHFDIDELYKDIEGEYHVSRSTVYNTIELLCECNILRKHYLNETQAVYELAEDKHLHLICLKCGAVKEVDGSVVSEYLSGLKFRGFHTTFSSVNIYGLCSACSRKPRKTQKPKP